MTETEKIYEEYKKRNDKIIYIENKKYYRIVFSTILKIECVGLEILSIIPCPDMPISSDYLYEDERGNHFTFEGYHSIRFAGKIPEWYLQAGECGLKWKETNEIGEYLTIV